MRTVLAILLILGLIPLFFMQEKYRDIKQDDPIIGNSYRFNQPLMVLTKQEGSPNIKKIGLSLEPLTWRTSVVGYPAEYYKVTRVIPAGDFLKVVGSYITEDRDRLAEAFGKSGGYSYLVLEDKNQQRYVFAPGDLEIIQILQEESCLDIKDCAPWQKYAESCLDKSCSIEVLVDVHNVYLGSLERREKNQEQAIEKLKIFAEKQGIEWFYTPQTESFITLRGQLTPEQVFTLFLHYENLGIELRSFSFTQL